MPEHEGGAASEIRERRAPTKRARSELEASPKIVVNDIALPPSPPTLADSDETEAQPAKRLRIDHDKEQAIPRRPHSPEPAHEHPNDTAPTARKDTRAVKPLPPRMNQPSHYDPTNMTGLPTRTEVNPHRMHTRNGTPPLMPEPGHAIFTDERFPHLPIPWYSLTGNMQDRQKDSLLREPEKHFLGLVHYAGKTLFQDDPHIVARVSNALRSFSFPGHDQPIVLVTRPEPKDGGKANPGRPFTQPWCLLIRTDSAPLRELCMWQRTFPFAANTSITLFPIDPEAKP
ncbi:hypothetical protein HDZ31DRAFT_68581 [Schizophyllum fasciatum]